MLYSSLFGKGIRNISSDLTSKNAQLLTKAGYVNMLMAGVYSYLPLGLRVLNNISNIVRDGMNSVGAQEILLPSLHPSSNWKQTGRWDSVDILFKLKSQTKREYALGPTHEEVIVPLVKEYAKSYKDYPVALFQIQTKFRDELRSKSGIMRGREFLMKDLYSFHLSSEDLLSYYDKVKDKYVDMFSNMGLESVITEASGGDFTKKYSHEFIVFTDAGEDSIVFCNNCKFAQNIEVFGEFKDQKCPNCSSELVVNKGAEVGNIFDLGTRFSSAFDLVVIDASGKEIPLCIGCYGIGISRSMGVIAEVYSDERGLKWPKSIAPYKAHLTFIGDNKEVADKIYETLNQNGIESLYDDRISLSSGEKLKDADLLGMPIRILISDKSLAQGKIEISKRESGDVELIEKDKLMNFLKSKI